MKTWKKTRQESCSSPSEEWIPWVYSIFRLVFLTISLFDAEVIQSSEIIYPHCSFSHSSCTLLRAWISKFPIHSLYRELITLARWQTMLLTELHWQTQKIKWESHELHKSHFNEILNWKFWRELPFSDSSSPPKRILSKKGAAEWRLLPRKSNLQEKGLYC